MEVTYQLTERDFLDAVTAHRDRSPLVKWSFRILLAIFVVISALLVVGKLARPETETNWVPLLIIGTFWVYCVFIAPRSFARKQFREQPSAKGQTTLLLDAQGVHWTWNGGTSHNEWKHFLRWYESKRHFLIYSSPAYFNIVPKRALTPEQTTELRALFEQNIVRK